METVKQITLHAQEIKKDKQSFIACSAEINNVWYKIKFVKGCEKAPTKRGLYILTIDFDNCSLEKGKWYTDKKGNDRKENDTIWVREISNIYQYTEEDLKASNRMTMASVFGD